MIRVISAKHPRDRLRRKQPQRKPHVVFYLFIAITLNVALGWTFPVQAAPAQPGDSLLDAFARSLALEQYDSARAIELAVLDSGGSAWGGLLRATRIVAEQADYGDTLETALFFQSIDSARSRFGGALKVYADTSSTVRAAWMEALGTLDGLEAQRYQEVENRPLAAVGPARQSAEWFREALALDSTRLSAKAGVLFYAFWHDQALRFLSWTPFIADRRAQTLEQLQQIVDSPHRAHWSTAPGLIWSLNEAGRPKQASLLADSLLRARGEIRNLLEPAGKAAFLEQRWGVASNRYERLLASIQGAPRLNRVREVGVLHRLAHIYVGPDSPGSRTGGRAAAYPQRAQTEKGRFQASP